MQLPAIRSYHPIRRRPQQEPDTDLQYEHPDSESLTKKIIPTEPPYPFRHPLPQRKRDGQVDSQKETGADQKDIEVDQKDTVVDQKDTGAEQRSAEDMDGQEDTPAEQRDG